MINKYKTSDGVEFLCYGEDPQLPEEFELIEKEVNPALEANRDLEILSYYDFCYKAFYGKRTDEMRLAEAGICTYTQFMAAHYLNMQKSLNRPAKIRKLVEERYAEILDNFPKENKEYAKDNNKQGRDS